MTLSAAIAGYSQKWTRRCIMAVREQQVPVCVQASRLWSSRGLEISSSGRCEFRSSGCVFFLFGFGSWILADVWSFLPAFLWLLLYILSFARFILTGTAYVLLCAWCMMPENLRLLLLCWWCKQMFLVFRLDWECLAYVWATWQTRWLELRQIGMY